MTAPLLQTHALNSIKSASRIPGYQSSACSQLNSPPVAVTWSSEDLRKAPRAPSVPGKTPHPCCEDISWHTNPQRRLHVEPMIHLPLKTFRANLIRPYNTVYLLSHSTHIPTQKCSNTNATQFPTSSDPQDLFLYLWNPRYLSLATSP